MDLRLGERGVDELAAVVDVDEPQELDLAHRDIDLDFRKAAPKGIGVVADRIRRFRRDVLRVGGVILRGHCELLERHQNLAVHDADDAAVSDVHVFSHLARDFGRVGKDLLLEKFARLPDGEARNIGLPGRIRAEAGRGDVGILTGNNVYVAVAGKAQNLCRHLRVCGVRALADLCFAALHRDGTVQVQLHPVGRGFKRNGINRGVVPEGCHADAAANGAGLVLIFLDLSVVIDRYAAFFHTVAEGIVVVDVVREAVFKALGHDEFVAVLEGVHADSFRAIFNICVVRERGLRHAVAAHRARNGAVGVDGVRVSLHVVAGINLRERAHGLGHDRVAVRRVRALIGEALDFSGGNRAVLMQPRNDVEPDGMAHTVGDKRFLARAVDADAPAVYLRRAPGAKRLIERVLLVAEAAADIGLDDLNICPRSSQRLTDDPADDVGDLRRGNDGNSAVLAVGIAAVVFNVAVLHHRRFVPALDLNKAGLLDRLVVIALGHGRVL